MSFSEYNGNKSKVSSTVCRILRNEHGNLPKIPTAQGSSSSSTLSSFLKSISNSNNYAGSERLAKQGGQSSFPKTSTSFPFPSSTTRTSKFGFQKLRLGSWDKKRGTNQHAELLDNQQDDQEDSDDDGESDPRGFISKSEWIDPPVLSSPPKQVHKKWRF